jgi:hypothetical protein
MFLNSSIKKPKHFIFSVNLEFPYQNVLDHFISKLYHGRKTLVFIQDSWGWVNLNYKYSAIAQMCIKTLKFSLQLQSHNGDIDHTKDG